MPELFTGLVDVYVFRRRGGETELLLLKRRKAIRLGETWQAVHGKIDKGEKASEAALRELREETGLTPLAFWQLEFVNTFYVADEDRIYMCPCFAAEVSAEEEVRLSDEHTDSRWERVERALSDFMWPGQRHAVQEIIQYIVTPSAAEAHLRLSDGERRE